MPFSPTRQNCLSVILPRFLSYARVEWQFSEQTLIKYQDCMRQIRKMIGDLEVDGIGKSELHELKSAMIERGNGVARQIVILSTFKRLLKFSRDELGLEVLDPESIKVPRRPRRELVYLTVDEVQRFIEVIPLKTKEGKPHRNGIRFRALVEMLLGSAMRIGEALSLDRAKIDFERREARVVGKGDKERTVFFTDRALHWAKQYVEIREDNHPALFVRQDGKGRLKRPDIWRPFARYRERAGIAKVVTPHILRHTAATTLLFNGCPVGHIKEILGHERLETTGRYYLGLDLRQAKRAHSRFLVFD